MREVIPFCQAYDKKPPKFLQHAIDNKLVRPECAPGPNSVPLNEKEQAKIKSLSDTYYQEHWSKIIFQFLRYASPNIVGS